MLVALALLAAPARASEPRVVVDFRLDGPASIDRLPVLAALGPLLGAPLDEARLLDAVLQLEQSAGVGGVDFVEIPRDSNVVLRVVYGSRTYVERVSITTGDEERPDRGASEKLRRQVRDAGHHLRVAEGQVFHPFHRDIDSAALRRYYMAQGYVEVVVLPEVVTHGDLTTVVFRVRLGRRFRTGAILVEGFTDPAAKGAVRNAVGAVPTPDGIEEARRLLAMTVCRQGHTDAIVTVATRPREDLQDLIFTVEAGPVWRIAGASWEGLPALVEPRGEPSTGAPFCRDEAAATAAQAELHLRAEGYLEAVVTLATVDDPARRTASLIYHVIPGELARVERIWFTGHTVTHEKILRQLVTLRAGDVVWQSAIDESVDDLRHSELFRRVSAQAVRSAKPGRYYVIFRLVERDFVSVDFTSQTVTLHNLYFGSPKSDRPVPLRGGGQTGKLRASSDSFSVGIADPFLWSSVIASFDLDLRLYEFSALEEAVFRARTAIGLRALANRFDLRLRTDTTVVARDAPASYDVLPVKSSGSAVYGLGLDTRLDLARLDAERVRYLGIEIRGDASTTGPMPGVAWSGWSLDMAVSAPLYRNRRGQHIVAQLSAGAEWAAGIGIGRDGFIGRERAIFAHQRLTPRARGYAPHAIRGDYTVGDDEVALGALAAYTSSATLRLPLPWRRNAVTAFCDYGSYGDRDEAPWANPFAGVGAELNISLFDESLEGSLYGALPLRDGVEAKYFGFGAGGSFD